MRFSSNDILICITRRHRGKRATVVKVTADAYELRYDKQWGNNGGKGFLRAGIVERTFALERRGR